jgi:hypothetical protein
MPSVRPLPGVVTHGQCVPAWSAPRGELEQPESDPDETGSGRQQKCLIDAGDRQYGHAWSGDRGLVSGAGVVVGVAVVVVLVAGGVASTSTAVVALRMTVTASAASKLAPAARHWLVDGQVNPFDVPVPAMFWMLCPLEMVPVVRSKGTACPIDGSSASLPTPRHCDAEGHQTAVSMAACTDMV